MLASPSVHGDIPNITADWEWWEKPSDVTISALQRGTWQANDGRVVKIFVNISNQNINFQIPDLMTSKINKISLDAYDLKIIEEP